MVVQYGLKNQTIIIRLKTTILVAVTKDEVLF